MANRSVIGDYVHYNQINYINFGINKKGETPSEDWNSAYNILKEKIQEMTELQRLLIDSKTLENMYNSLYYGIGDSDAESIRFREAMKQASQEKLEETFGLMAGKFNPNSVGVDSSKNYEIMRNALKATRKVIGKIELFHQNETVNGVNKKLDQILKIFDQNEYKNLDIAKQRIEESKNFINNIKQRISKDIGVNLNNNDIETLNKIIVEFNRDPLLYNQAGDLFEWVIPLINLKGSNLAQNELVKAMKDLMVSSNVGAGYITVEVPDLLNSQDLELDIQTNNIKMKSETIRNKTDVTLSYNDNNNQYNNLNVSAKSISGKHIKLVELTSLYRVFVLSNNYSFATHYLNVITSSNGNGVISKEQVLKANRIVKALALKMGAEGYDINNPSELLIVNNRKEKHIYVYNLKAMVYLISKAMLEENKYTSVIKGLSDNFTIQQSFDSSSSDNRIGKLVHKLNDIKITGVLSGAQLDAYKSVLEKQS